MKYWTSTESIYIATEISRDGMHTRRVLWMQINCITRIHACYTCTCAIYCVQFFFHKLLCNLFVNIPDDLFSQFFFSCSILKSKRAVYDFYLESVPVLLLLNATVHRFVGNRSLKAKTYNNHDVVCTAILLWDVYDVSVGRAIEFANIFWC